jgi:L-iditol 2-dehydrogenase
LPLFPIDRAVVVGLGVTGLLHVQLLRARGVTTVVGVGRSASKRRLAEALGASATCTPDEAPGVVAKMTDGRGAAAVVEAAGSGPAVALAVTLAGFAATVVVFGTAAGAGHEMPLYEMYRKELTVVHPRAAVSADYEDAIALIAAGTIRGAPLVTDHAALEDAPNVFATWPDHPERLKVVFEPSALKR